MFAEESRFELVPSPSRVFEPSVASPRYELDEGGERERSDRSRSWTVTADFAGTHFRTWVGRSGRRYVFSVYDPETCPGYCDGVVLSVLVGSDGDRRVINAAQTGVFPEPTLHRLALDLTGRSGRPELHVHLLAETPEDRRAVIADLT